MSAVVLLKRPRGGAGGLGSLDELGDEFSVSVVGTELWVGTGGSVGRWTEWESPPDRQAARSSTVAAMLAVRFMCTRMTLEGLLELAAT
jgi:hypothetical protein